MSRSAARNVRLSMTCASTSAHSSVPSEGRTTEGDTDASTGDSSGDVAVGLRSVTADGETVERPVTRTGVAGAVPLTPAPPGAAFANAHMASTPYCISRRTMPKACSCQGTAHTSSQTSVRTRNTNEQQAPAQPLWASGHF